MTANRFLALTFTLLLAVPAFCADAPAAAPAAPAAPAAAPTLAPGDKAPDFTLTDTAGVSHSLSKYLADGKIVVLEWFNPDCPFIIKHHKLNKTMNETFAYMTHEGVVWLAINSSAAGKQGAGLERNQAAHKEYEMTFPILMDESGKVGRAYGAKTTPHMFIIGKDGKLFYSGAIDDDPSPTQAGQRNYIISALRAALEGRPAPEPTTKPYGCSVKYAN
jgi:peroxiredoxin